MSQSRNEQSDRGRVPRRPLADLSAMIGEGRSFSGRERHCCFLNTLGHETATGRFANISAASGLDYADNGRAVVATDWDQDGDVDLWISNRNAPRVRFLRNNLNTNNTFLALRLIGNGKDTNRDAIGARVELTVLGSWFSVPGSGDNREPRTENRQRSTKTLHAGEGFLAQSSKWLHFGIEKGAAVEKVVVHWPTKNDQLRVDEFTGLEPGRWYELVQGSTAARSVDRPTRQLRIEPSRPELPSPSPGATIHLTYRMKLPALGYRESTG